MYLSEEVSQFIIVVSQSITRNNNMQMTKGFPAP